MAPTEKRKEATVTSMYVSEESVPGRRGPVADPGARLHPHDRLLEVAEHQAALAKVRGDSYAELLIAADGISASGRTQPMVLVRLGTEFRGIPFAGH